MRRVAINTEAMVDTGSLQLTLQDMPNEILDAIIAYLPVPGLLALSGACRAFAPWSPRPIVAEARLALLKLIICRANEAIYLAPANVPDLAGVIANTGVYSYTLNAATVTFIARRGCVIDLTLYRPKQGGHYMFSPGPISFMYRGAVYWPDQGPGPGINYICHVRRVTSPATYIPCTIWQVVTRSGKKFYEHLSRDGKIYCDGYPSSLPPSDSLEDALMALKRASE